MIATLVAEESARTGHSKTSTKRKAHVNARHIPVDVDERVWKDVCNSLPVTGVNYQTADLNRECRLIVASFILVALRNRDCSFSFLQEVQDKMTMVGHRKRKALVSFFHQSPFFAQIANHSADNQSIARCLKGAKLVRLYADQHIWYGVKGGVMMDDGYHADEDVDDAMLTLRSWPCYWAYAGKTLRVHIPVEWYRKYWLAFRNACSSLFPEQWQFVPCIKSSLERAVVGKPTFEDCLKLASLRTPKAGEHSWTDEKWAMEMLKRWNEWKDDPMLYLNRVERRLYYPFVNQSKHLRRRYMQFEHNGRLEPVAEVDMSATYWVLLTSMLDESPCKARLIQDLNEGRFYERLNQAVGEIYTAPSELKAAVQKDCLFGKERFGKTRLFLAMGRLYPDLARIIMHKRGHHNVTWLSDQLTNLEGSFFIDCLLPLIVKAGIPALPLHDAFCVPASAAKPVQQICREQAQGRFGFEPKFKVKLDLTT